MNISNLDCIAILGYSDKSSKKLKPKVDKLTNRIIMHGIALCAGSILGPVYFTFKKMKLFSGNRKLVGRTKISHKDRHLCDILEMVSTQEEKHELIARVCVSSIVISNNFRTQHLTGCFASQKKKTQYLSKLPTDDLSNINISLRSEYRNALVERKMS